MSNEQSNMSLTGHLRELRNRIALSFIVLLVAFFACFAFIKPIVNVMLEMGVARGFSLVYISPSEVLTANFKMALIFALVIVSPVLAFQIWGFVAPALTKREKRAILPALFGGFVFFVIGACFAYFISIPFMIQFLARYSVSELITSSISVASYLDFMIGMLLVFGVVFEEPMLAFVLSRLGIITPQILRKLRAYAIPLIFLVGAIITPPDVVSQCMVAIPMIALYQLGIFISAIEARRREKREALEEEDEEDDEDEDEDEDDD